MKRLVEVEPICPFLGKTCIKDGWQYFNQKIIHPCAFWDDFPHNGIDPEEPCRLKRAVNKILSDEESDEIDFNRTIEVPFNSEKE